MTVNVLGTEYTVLVKKYDEDEAFARREINGYCDGLMKQIAVCDMDTYKGLEHEPKEYCAACQRQAVRHEIVHAFFFESGLSESSNTVNVPWATNEELVDWMAWQGPKIYAAWREAGALDDLPFSANQITIDGMELARNVCKIACCGGDGNGGGR